MRSQNVALSGEENIDFDAGRRRLLRAKNKRRHQRRLQRAAAIAAAVKGAGQRKKH